MRAAAPLVCAVAALTACAGPRARPAAPSTASSPGAPATAAAPAVVTSNIVRRDYAGSRACAPCHAEEYEKFMAAPMHNMTRLPGPDVPMPAFDGAFRFKGDAVRFETRDGERYMHIDSREQGTRTFRITKVIGGHYREDFAGVEVGGRDEHTERVLPVSYFLPTQRWRYKGYSVMGPERPGLRPGGVWARTCIFCHNTVPYFDDLLGALADPRTGPYQGEVVDPLLPSARRARFDVTDPGGFQRAIADELGALGAPPPRAAGTALLASELIRATRARFDAQKVVELGIGCESCHGGSAEHVRHNATKPSYAPRAPFLRASLPGAGDERARDVNRVCARCHQVLFTQYPWTWEGARRDGATPGGSHINSGEARDMLLGGCADRLACSDCHDPHAHNKPTEPALEARADGICLGCHEKYTSAEAQRAHTHHDPAGAGGRCLGCHMPRKNMSLDNGLTRYHRIASPTETAKVEGDRPLECALCHGDRPVETLVTTMETWWHKSYDRGRLRALYGDDLGHADPIGTTIARGKPHEQAVALALAGERKQRQWAALAAVQLTHPIPILRYYALKALEAMVGPAPPTLDLHGDNGALRAEAERWLGAAGVKLPLASGTSAGPTASDKRGSDED